MSEARKTETPRPRLFWALLIAMVLLVGWSITLSALTTPEPVTVAPGPSYYNEEPLETT